MEPDSTLYVNQSDFTTAYADYTAVWRVGKVFQSPECFLGIISQNLEHHL